MSLPGYTAEAALPRSGRNYRAGVGPGYAMGAGASAVVVPSNLQGCLTSLGNIPGACSSDAITCLQTAGSVLYECPGVIVEGVGSLVDGVVSLWHTIFD